MKIGRAMRRVLGVMRAMVAVLAMVGIVASVAVPVNAAESEGPTKLVSNPGDSTKCLFTTDDDDSNNKTDLPTPGNSNAGYDLKIYTSILDCRKLKMDNGEAIYYILSIGINILTFGIAAAATVGLIISGYQYMTARDNVAQIQKAKNRILQIVIGLAIYALFWALAYFLIPGFRSDMGGSV